MKLFKLIADALRRLQARDEVTRRDVRLHLYAAPRTPEEWSHGKDTCMHCGRTDALRRRLTHPPCPGPRID